MFTATIPGVYEVGVLKEGRLANYSPATVTVVEAASGVSLNNHNVLAVQNGGTPPTFEFEDVMKLLTVQTYHYNLGSGVGETGEISLQAEDGTVYGPYATEGREGQGGVPNAYWTATPDVELPPGSYTVIDSDPSTWSQNSGSGGEGFVVIEGEVAETEE
jgi:hypothetical protein